MHPPRIKLNWPSARVIFARTVPLSRQSLPRPCQTQRRTIRSIVKPAPTVSRFDHNPSRPSRGASPAAAIQRRLDSNTLQVRTGALAIKKGMAAVFDASTGKRTPVTVLQLDRVQVLAHKTRANNGYDAVVVGYGWQSAHRVNRAMLGVYSNATFEDEAGETTGIAPKRYVREFQVRGEKEPGGRQKLPVGEEIKATWWSVGDYVDVKGVTRGMGFAGVMKRHGFKGQGASHGVSLTHRSLGSAGGGQGSGSRVHPGKKMAGRMGNENHTIQSLKIMSVDEENGLIAVCGSVPGPKKGLVRIVDAVKKPWPAVREAELPKKRTEATVDQSPPSTTPSQGEAQAA